MVGSAYPVVGSNAATVISSSVQQGDHSQLFNGHDSRVAAQPLAAFRHSPAAWLRLGGARLARNRPAETGDRRRQPVQPSCETLSGFRASAVFPGHSNSARNQRSRLSACAGGQGSSLDEQDLVDPGSGKLECSGDSNNTASDDDDFGGRGSAGDGSIERFDNDELIISMAIFRGRPNHTSTTDRSVPIQSWPALCALAIVRDRHRATPQHKIAPATAARRAARSQSTILMHSRGLRVQLGNNNRLEDVNAK